LSLQPLGGHAGHQMGGSAFDFVELIDLGRRHQQSRWSLRRFVRVTVVKGVGWRSGIRRGRILLEWIIHGRYHTSIFGQNRCRSMVISIVPA
jgi:hypothetical protein